MATASQRQAWIKIIKALPAKLEALVEPFSAEQLIARPLAHEWSIAQNVHHLVDSHMNSYVRLKLVLTEDRPVLKAYDQDAWAMHADAQSSDLTASMMVLKGLHARWASVFEGLPDDAWGRVGLHSEAGEISVLDLLSGYAEHCDDHIAQIGRVIVALGA